MRFLIKYVAAFCLCISIVGIHYQLQAQSTDGALHSFKYFLFTKDTFTNKRINKVDVLMQNGSNILSGQVDSLGAYYTTRAFADFWDFYLGRWGYLTRHLFQYIDSARNGMFVKLVPGYYDDFLFDYQWTSSTYKGITWNRLLTDSSKSDGRIPKYADTAVYSAYMLLTGTYGHIMDTGVLFIQSPLINLSKYKAPQLYFNWFAGTTKGANNDSLYIFGVAGSDTVLISGMACRDTVAAWHYDHIPLNSPFKADTGYLVIKAVSHSGHLAAGIGKVLITGNTSDINEPDLGHVKQCEKNLLKFSNDFATLTLNSNKINQMCVYNLNGQLMYSVGQKANIIIPVNNWPSGIYMLQLKDGTQSCITPIRVIH